MNELIENQIIASPLQDNDNNNTEEVQYTQQLDKFGRSYATGKRKSAIAKVWLKKGKGNIIVNKQEITKYFSRHVLRAIINQPLKLTERISHYDLNISVNGGGLSGQAGAVRHGITKALINYEPEMRGILKKNKLTTRDDRVVERKKYGRKKARRSFQFSKR